MSELVVEVCSRDEAGAILSAAGSGVTFLISIGETQDVLPAGYDNVAAKIRLTFADAYDGTGAKEHDVQRIIDAARTLAARPGRVLIHCAAGISRSSAAAFIIHTVLLGAGREDEALARVLEQRPIAKPNRRMLEIADRLLERGGAVTAALDRM
ncbi:MAG TPA: hypothetical protein VGR02_02475 [Thermoanaerobaculia bacterium]|jgi:predicted protein tyrosine phosphatase|nr:hypothetical protein [Thermoanaerobaculia bacterium]